RRQALRDRRRDERNPEDRHLEADPGEAVTSIRNQEPRIKGRSIVAFVILISAGCGKKEAGGAALETPEYQAWKGSQGIRQMASAGPSDKIDGTVTVHFPQERSKHPEDFVELCLNGQIVQHTRIRTTSGFASPLAIPIALRPGPDWLDVWDTTTNKNYRFQIDARQGTDYVLTPSAAGY